MEPTSIASTLPSTLPSMLSIPGVPGGQVPVDVFWLSLQMLMFCGAVAVLTEIAIRLLLLKLTKAQLYSIEKLVPVILGLLMGFVPGTIPGALPGPAYLYGIMAGGLSGQAYGIIKRIATKAERQIGGGK